jgi:hypothetical protein
MWKENITVALYFPLSLEYMLFLFIMVWRAKYATGKISPCV